MDGCSEVPRSGAKNFAMFSDAQLYFCGAGEGGLGHIIIQRFADAERRRCFGGAVIECNFTGGCYPPRKLSAKGVDLQRQGGRYVRDGGHERQMSRETFAHGARELQTH